MKTLRAGEDEPKAHIGDHTCDRSECGFTSRSGVAGDGHVS